MNLAIMQPYFMPYIGYFQLIAAVDQFIVYDNIKYTKKGWINRNRMLMNGKSTTFTLPLKKDSDSLDVVMRELATDFSRDKLLNQFIEAYRAAPFFEQTLPLLETIVRHKESNLFGFVLHSIVKTCEHLGIKTEIRVSSKIDIDHCLKGQNKVLALCEALGANTYINAIGGFDLYDRDTFYAHDIELKFIQSKQFKYPQFGTLFIPSLSIVDVLMFNQLATVGTCIASNYELV